MDFINQDHLRVRKVRTQDGMTPFMIDDKIQYKYVLMPMSAKKQLEEQNNIKPTSLKMKIEVVEAYRPKPVTPQDDPRIKELEAKVKEAESKEKEYEELKARLAALEAEKTAVKPAKAVKAEAQTA